jgi:hypothetical protein
MADMMSMFDAPPPSNAGAPAQNNNNMSDLMNGFEGLNFGGQSTGGEPLPAAMQLQNAQGGAPPPPPQKDSDDLLGLL